MTAATLNHEVFAARVGDSFKVAAGEPGLALELVEVRTLGPAAAAGRQPFSLLFLGPEAPQLPQRIHPLRHPLLGAVDIFLVPIGPEARGMRYEAVFN